MTTLIEKIKLKDDLERCISNTIDNYLETIFKDELDAELDHDELDCLSRSVFDRWFNTIEIIFTSKTPNDYNTHNIYKLSDGEFVVWESDDQDYFIAQDFILEKLNNFLYTS